MAACRAIAPGARPAAIPWASASSEVANPSVTRFGSQVLRSTSVSSSCRPSGPIRPAGPALTQQHQGQQAGDLRVGRAAAGAASGPGRRPGRPGPRRSGRCPRPRCGRGCRPAAPPGRPAATGRRPSRRRAGPVAGPAAISFFRARVSRAAMVGTLTRCAAAMAAVDTPQAQRRVSATWSASGSRGSAHSTVSRSSSSPITPASIRASAGGATCGVRSTSRVAIRRASWSRRIRSSALRRATVTSQASDRIGDAGPGPGLQAATNASAVASSATSGSRTARRVTARIRPDSSARALAVACATAAAPAPTYAPNSQIGRTSM